MQSTQAETNPGAKRALITGLTGQDGSYLAEFLLGKGYEVFGVVRRTSSPRGHHSEARSPGVRMLQADLLDQSSLMRAMEQCQPHEIYNLAAQSFVPTSFEEPVLTGEITGLGVTRMLEAMRHVCPEARFYQASTSELFGRVHESPQSERTPFHPRSPYGVSKLYAHWTTVNYRESYDLFCTSGLLFNHESPRRGLEFVTRKVTHTAAAISLGLTDELRLGNLEARRDWGFAGDYVRAMWAMLQHDTPEDFVIATGETRSVRELCEAAFGEVKLDWRDYVVVDPNFLRPAEVDLLVGDASKAKEKLGWEPEVSFGELISMMVANDLELLSRRSFDSPVFSA